MANQPQITDRLDALARAAVKLKEKRDCAVLALHCAAWRGQMFGGAQTERTHEMIYLLREALVA